MANTFGFGTDTTGFSTTVHEHILKEVIATLRAGLVAMPKGSVVPAVIAGQRGETFTLESTAYPDLASGTATDPLTEGVAPTALKLGIDPMQWTVTQSGARTVVTDIAQFQSPHNLARIAADKIARLAADNFDDVALAAIASGASDLGDGLQPLSTDILLDVTATMQSRNVAPTPAGYAVILHPNALRGLTGETDLNGYTDVIAQAASGSLTSGAVGQYRGCIFLPTTKLVDSVGDGTGNYPVYVLGSGSLSAGDMGTFEPVNWSGPGVGNELNQLMGFGYKAIFGVKVNDFSETTDGSGTNASTTARAVQFTVTNGASNILS